MEKYEGPLGTGCNEEITSLIATAQQNQRQTFTDLNGVKLIADPKEQAARPNYAEELRWTFWRLLNHERIMTASLGERDEWRNAVPELEKLCARLMETFETLDRGNPREVLSWFVQLTAITWCKGVMSDKQRMYVRSSLEDHEEYRGSRYVTDNDKPVNPRLQGYHHIKMAMGSLTPLTRTDGSLVYSTLTEGWLKDAQAWLANKA